MLYRGMWSRAAKNRGGSSSPAERDPEDLPLRSRRCIFVWLLVVVDRGESGALEAISMRALEDWWRSRCAASSGEGAASGAALPPFEGAGVDAPSTRVRVGLRASATPGPATSEAEVPPPGPASRVSTSSRAELDLTGTGRCRFWAEGDVEEAVGGVTPMVGSTGDCSIRSSVALWMSAPSTLSSDPRDPCEPQTRSDSDSNGFRNDCAVCGGPSHCSEEIMLGRGGTMTNVSVASAGRSPSPCEL